MEALHHAHGTPCHRLHLPRGNRLYLKLEGENPSGSIKDRLAAHLVLGALRDGHVRKGQRLVEVSSGNAAVAFARAARCAGLRAELLVPDSTRRALVDRVLYYDAFPVLLPAARGPSLAFDEARRRREEGAWWPDQYHNRACLGAYTGLVEELVGGLPQVDCLVAAVGTGSTLLGVGSLLKRRWPHLAIVAVEPSEGESIEGIRNTQQIHGGADDLYDRGFAQTTFHVRKAEAHDGVRMLRKLGIHAGASSGAVLCAALDMLSSSVGRHVVLICADGRYAR